MAIVRPGNRDEVQERRPDREPVSHPDLSDQHGQELGLRLARAGDGRRAARSRPPEPHRRLRRGAGVRHDRARRDAAPALRVSPGARVAGCGWTRPARARTAASSATRWSAGSATRRWATTARNVCGFEVVLPTGECIETGFAGSLGAGRSRCSRWGVGPSLDGLFSQSNLGIVTRMTRVADARAGALRGVLLHLPRRGRPRARIVDALRPLRLNGTLRSVMHIGNDYKVLTASGPVAAGWPTSARAARSRAMARLRQELGIGDWNGSGGLYGTRPRSGKRGDS